MGLVSERSSVGQLEGGLSGVVCIHSVHIVLEDLGNVTVTWPLNCLELLPGLLVRTCACQTCGHCRVRWLRCSAALVHSTLDQHVSIHAPACSPAVLDLPVIGATGGAETNGKDTMIQVCTAAACQDSRAVHLEGELVCFNCNRHWASVGDGIQQLGLAADVLVAGDTTLWDGCGVAALAAAITSSVWVRRLRGNAGLLVEGECIVHETSIATRVLLGAIHQLLLGERLEAARGNLPLALGTTSGGECPAGSALTLILHWSDGTLGGPVNGRHCWLARVHMLTNLWQITVQAARLVAKNLLVLLMGLVSERSSVGQLERGLSGVVCIHSVHIVLEDLGNVTVTWPLNCLELLPGLLVRTCACQACGHCRVRWLRCNAALVHSTLDQHVAVHAPACPPAVLDLPVISATRGAETNGKDTMIQVCTAAACQDSRAVHLEGHLVCFNCNGHWSSVGDGIQQVGLTADVLVASDTTLRDGCGVAALAAAITGSVWVR